MPTIERGPPEPPPKPTGRGHASASAVTRNSPGKPAKERNPRLSSSDEAVALVQQEMSNLKALKRLSIGAMLSPLDPDLPGFPPLPDSYTPEKRHPAQDEIEEGPESAPREEDEPTGLKRTASGRRERTYTPGRRLNIEPSEAHDLIWVPARLHPEIAPQEWRSYVENRVQEIQSGAEHQHRGSAESSSSSAAAAAGPASRLSHEIANSADYMDASDVLERRRRSSNPKDTRRLSILELSTQLKSLGELESLAALSGSFSSSDDQPWSPPPEDNLDQPLSPGASLRRSGGSSRRRNRPEIRRKKAASDDSPPTTPVTPTSAAPPDVPAQSPDRFEPRRTRSLVREQPHEPELAETREFTVYKENIYTDYETAEPGVPERALPPADREPGVAEPATARPAERVFYGAATPSKPLRPTGLTIDVGVNPHQAAPEEKKKPLWRWLKQDKEKDKEKDKEDKEESAPHSPTTQMFSKMFKKKKKEAQSSPPPVPPPEAPAHAAPAPDQRGGSPEPLLVPSETDAPNRPSSRPGHSRQRSRTTNYAWGDDKTQQARSLQGEQRSKRSGQEELAAEEPAPASAQPMQLPYEIPAHQLSDRSNIMMYHRFPLHIERAIYRLSHMKLANPRRPLSQQVLLSNFMYAYLNLINQGYQRQMEAATTAGGPVEVEEEDEVPDDGFASYDVSYMQSEGEPDPQYFEQHEDYEAPTDFEFFQNQSSSSSESDASEEMHEMWDEHDREYNQPIVA